MQNVLQSGGEAEWGSLMKRPFIRVLENGNGVLPYPGIPNICSEQLMKLLLKPQLVNHPGTLTPAPAIQDTGVKGASLQEARIIEGMIKQQPQPIPSENKLLQNQHHPQACIEQPDAAKSDLESQANLLGQVQPLNKLENQTPPGKAENSNIEPVPTANQLSQLKSAGQVDEEKLAVHPKNSQNLVSQPTLSSPNKDPTQLQSSSWLMQPPHLESSIFHAQPISAPPFVSSPNALPPYIDTDEWILYPSANQSFGGVLRSSGPLSGFGLQDPSPVFPEAIIPSLPSMGSETWDQQLNNVKCLSQADQLPPFPQQDPCNINCISSSSGLRDLSDDSNNQSGIYSCLNFDVSNGGSTAVDPSVSSTILDDFCTFKDADFANPSDCLVGNFSTSQDVQSQITSASLADSQAFSRADFMDNSGGTSSSNIDFDESSLLQNSSWQQVAAPPMRTYTKV